MRAAKRLNNVIRSVGIVVGLVIGGASVKVLLSLEEFSQRILKEHKEENKAAKEKQVAFA
jgi:transcription antitermination factor NusG